jgi:hypothetical protein
MVCRVIHVFIAVLTRMFLYACWLVVNTLIRLLIRDTQGWGNGDMGEVKTIVRLQKKLQRALDGGMNDSKTLRYLNELYTIPMTVDLLQETGVGKTVNRLSHMDGQVAQTAKRLVRKWRKLVKEVNREHQGDSEAHERVDTKQAGHGDFKETEPKRPKVESATVHNDKKGITYGHAPHSQYVTSGGLSDKEKNGKSMLVDVPVPVYTPSHVVVRATCTEGAESQHRKKVPVADDDIMIGSSRRSLSLVYSGKKRRGPSIVPSLFQLSMRVLIDNIDGKLQVS